MTKLNELMREFFNYVQGGISTIIPDKSISIGLTIIAVVIIVKLLLIPLNIKQIKSTIKMNEIQPEMKKLQNKYKKDPQKLNQEMMKLYKENGANPLGGCLPTLLQMPILFGLFYLFRDLDTIKGVGFLWITDLSKPNILLAILSGLTTYFSSASMMQTGDSNQGKKMGSMNIIMSGMMFIFGMSLNAAIVLYYVVSNVFQLGQTVLTKRLTSQQNVAK